MLCLARCRPRMPTGSEQGLRSCPVGRFDAQIHRQISSGRSFRREVRRLEEPSVRPKQGLVKPENADQETGKRWMRCHFIPFHAKSCQIRTSGSKGVKHAFVCVSRMRSTGSTMGFEVRVRTNMKSGWRAQGRIGMDTRCDGRLSNICIGSRALRQAEQNAKPESGFRLD